MIELENVSKTFGGQVALSNVSLKVERGDMAFITGPSGAGKTTLFKLLYLADKPDTGTITIAGCNAADVKSSYIPLLRRNIGVVFQDFKLLNNKTVYDNIALTLRIRGFMEREIKERVHSVLKMVNLRHKVDNYPLTLSGGEQQRITIARSIVGEPTVMLADEPTGNLDEENEKEIMRIFKQINAKGTTILIATHNRMLYKNTARKVFTLETGQLKDEEEE
ncbi:cell division ATP-binding protein FtsE [Candidatus Magnetominusculus xianensis]|uniref:Cell division ATP-binding protein FtsE n=1 Tax=Candidatus Magnetominusculus xianensis TaxID=1748249 RepID=A0ABR5SIH1_9BACT|nr:cell division ATP-binding protein FtsE [Candidatus Magnetominusculus xianensis]KWT84423.1 cell division protein FtsE [Candidatus Magnetominusculus xianensis]MBF0404257.1 cell division ATP-binding protein FtsE [Nitrospirota bacterium]